MNKIRSLILLSLTIAGFNAFAISAPSITSCTRTSSTSVSLAWTSVSGASYYVVKRSWTASSSSASTLGTPTGTSYTDSQAGVDTCYYWVEAWDSSGAHAISGMATAASGSGGGSSGGSFTINASDGTSTEGVIITWSAQSGATGYRVVRGNTSNMDNAGILVETVTGTSYTDTTAVAGKTYYYWIVAKKSSGYVTSSYNTGYRASSSGGGSGSGSSYNGQPYTVKFNANGGTGSMANESFVYGTPKALTICTFTRTGYTFVGWATSSSATTSTYDDGEEVSNLTTTSGGTVNLYAVWQANVYTVKFNANGGTGSMANESFVYGTPKALTICTFTRTGYIFVGWATSSSATTSTYDDGQSVSNLTTTSGGTVNLYAVWQANAYTIKFNANGGTGTMANLAMTYDVAKALTANAFQRVNYRFMGWATSASATTATYSNKQSVSNLTATPDGTVNLYAVWKLVLEVTSVTARQRYPWNGLVDIDVTFAASGLSTVSFEVKDTAGNTNLNARTFYVGNPSENNRTLEVQPGTRRFVWDAFADLGQVTLSSFAVTAKVTEKNFQVNVTGGTGAGSFVQGKSVTISAASKTGYTFTSWSGTTADTGLLASATSASTTLTIPSRDVAYEATYTPNTYTVKFNANGGSGTMPVESFTYDVSKALTANAFTNGDYLFLGWAESADSTMVKYKNKQSVKNLITSGTKNLYAVWTSEECVQLWENGPYWAKRNIGESSNVNGGAGYFFWWGDTVGYKRSGGSYDNWFYEDYHLVRYTGVTWVSSKGVSMSSSPFDRGNCPTYNKSISQLQSAGYLDSNGNLKAKYDAATVHLGAPWRMPTKAEFSALTNNCTVTYVTSGSKGLRITGKGNYASKSIFLSTTGYGIAACFYDYPSGYYLSSSPYSNENNYEYASIFYSYIKSGENQYNVTRKERYEGVPIRPVISANE